MKAPVLSTEMPDTVSDCEIRKMRLKKVQLFDRVDNGRRDRTMPRPIMATFYSSLVPDVPPPCRPRVKGKSG
jgi:hypothetical protein